MRAPVKRRGRKRGEFCMGTFGVFHRLTESTRRWKVRIRKSDGLPVVMANGCKACCSIGNALRDARRDSMHAKLRRCGVAA